MRVITGTLMVLWTRHEFSGVVCEADLATLPGEGIQEAKARYASMFPADTIIGIKDSSYRFVG